MPTEDCQVRWAGPHAVVTVPAEIDTANAGDIRCGLLSAVSLGAAMPSCWQAHVQADLGTVAAGADFDQVAQLIHYP